MPIQREERFTLKHDHLLATLAIAAIAGLLPSGARADELFVSSRNTNTVTRFDRDGAPLPGPGQPGAFFVPPGSGGLSSPRGLAFGPYGNLYVSSTSTNSVLRYDGETG